MKFVKSGDATLNKGGYLVDAQDQPVNHTDFVEAQIKAHRVITLASLAKGKTFDTVQGYSKAQLMADLNEALSVKNYTYVDTPQAPVQTINNQLAEEALAFMKYGKEKQKADRVNEYMQAFNTLSDYESFGLYFTEGLVKLTKVYTLEEIKNAVTEVIDLV